VEATEATESSWRGWSAYQEQFLIEMREFYQAKWDQRVELLQRKGLDKTLKDELKNVSAMCKSFVLDAYLAASIMQPQRHRNTILYLSLARALNIELFLTSIGFETKKVFPQVGRRCVLLDNDIWYRPAQAPSTDSEELRYPIVVGETLPNNYNRPPPAEVIPAAKTLPNNDDDPQDWWVVVRCSGVLSLAISLIGLGVTLRNIRP
jgi:hypothetical protein